MADRKEITIKVQLEFPSDVNLEGAEDKVYNILELSDYLELMVNYGALQRKGLYKSFKDKNFRWVFFSDTYDTYGEEDIENLVLCVNQAKDAPPQKTDSVFLERWYQRKFMTVFTLDNNLKYRSYTIPATYQEYFEDKAAFDILYRILKRNNDVVGKYLKTENK